MSTSLFNLKGKNALVTGSNRGLGAGMAIGLAQAGANVALHGLLPIPAELKAEIESAGVKYITILGDVSNKDDCARIIDETVSGLGSIDILVNNAGIIRRTPAVDYSAEDWQDVIDVNLTSIFRLCQLAGRHMLKQGHGKIINVASLLSFQGGINVPAYAAAKGGVAQLTKALANEWASKGVNVNAIAPGYMSTENTAALRADAARSKQILERIPAGRWGEPHDLAGVAVFLASDASN